jgi:hypothetical protein
MPPLARAYSCKLGAKNEQATTLGAAKTSELKRRRSPRLGLLTRRGMRQSVQRTLTAAPPG